MNAKDRAQRVVGLETIKAKAADLLEKGNTPFEVRAFVDTARKELVRQKPDWEKYASALSAAEKAKSIF